DGRGVGGGGAVQVVGGGHAGRQGRARHLDGVVARQEVAEGVAAVAAGRGGGDHGAGAVEELDGDAVDTGLAAVLDAVGVGVAPDPVADRGGAAIAEVDVGAHLAAGEGDGRGVGGGGAIQVVGGGHAGRQGRARHLDGVVARQEVAEGVTPVAAGCGGGDHGAGAVEELDGDAVDTGLAAVLDAVGVGVAPDPVADRGGAAIAEVDVGAHLAAGEGDGRGV